MKNVLKRSSTPKASQFKSEVKKYNNLFKLVNEYYSAIEDEKWQGLFLNNPILSFFYEKVIVVSFPNASIPN
jgi:hypothetical protein